MFCKQCGEELFDGQTICIKCGASISSEKQDGFEDKKKVVKSKKGLTEQNKLIVIALCALFGGVGAHNFYMGETKKGIIKIVFCFVGISLILSMIDLVKIILNKYTCEV